jgi:hypothetical protein
MGKLSRHSAVMIIVAGAAGLAACTPFPDVPERAAQDAASSYPALVTTDALVGLIPPDDRLSDDAAGELEARGEAAWRKAALALPPRATDLAAKGAQLRRNAQLTTPSVAPDLARRGAALRDGAELARREVVDVATRERLREGREALGAVAQAHQSPAPGSDVRIGDARRLLDLVETEKFAGLASRGGSDPALEARLARLHEVAERDADTASADRARRRADLARRATEAGAEDLSGLSPEERRRLLLERLRLSREGATGATD